MVEHPSIEQLRKLADLNLCDKDKIVYKQLIEPGIRGIVRDYWRDWNEIEWRVTIMTMITEGVYKKRGSIVISFDSPEEAKRYQDDMDVELFKKIERRNFKWKIDRLHKKGILSDYAYKLLDILRNKRNRIHRPLARLSEQELVEFTYGSSVVDNLWLTMFDKLDEETISNMRKAIEKRAKLYCSLIKD